MQVITNKVEVYFTLGKNVKQIVIQICPRGSYDSDNQHKNARREPQLLCTFTTSFKCIYAIRCLDLNLNLNVIENTTFRIGFGKNSIKCIQ